MPASNSPALSERIPLWRRINTVLVLTLLAVVLGTVAVIQGLNIRILRTQARLQVQAQLESVVELKEQQLQRWIDDSQHVLREIVVNPLVGQFRDLASQPNAAELRATSSRVLASLVEPAPNGTRRYQRVWFYLPDGRVVAASDPRDIDKVVSRQNYFDLSLAQPQVVPPFYSANTGELTLITTYPLLAPGTSEVQGVIAAELDLSVLASLMLERSGLGDSGETYLVSLESNYFLTPSRFEGVTMQRAYHSAGIDAALTQTNGSGTYQNYRSQEVLGVYRWIPALQAGLLAEVETSQAFQAVNKSLRSTLLLAALVLLGVIGLGGLVSWRLARQIRVLESGARRVALGDFSAAVPVLSGNELGLLARSFNTMASEMASDRRTLEERVSERTAALAASNAEQARLLDDLQMTARARDQLQETIRNLSIPVVPVLEGIVVMPLVGEIDAERANAMMQALMQSISTHRARYALIDVTGVPLIDTHIAAALIQMVRAAELLGTASIMVGIRPELAQTLVSLGLALEGVVTRADLQSGVMYAVRRLNREHELRAA